MDKDGEDDLIQGCIERLDSLDALQCLGKDDLILISSYMTSLLILKNNKFCSSHINKLKS